MRRTAIATLLIALGASPAFAVGAIAPYLQAATPTSITVMWRSGAPAAGRLVWRPVGVSRAQELADAPTLAHQFRLEGLAPGSEYVYEAWEGTRKVGEGTFRTAPAASGRRFRFAVFGDTGSGSAHQAAIARRLTAWKPDFVLHTGDVIYERGEAENFVPRFFKPYGPLLAGTPMYLSPGNHDYLTARAANYLGFFEAPRARPTDTERWYTFSWGHAQFFALDTNAPFGEGSEQHAWLAAQLARSKAAWKMAFFHHPPYSGGAHGSSGFVRAAFGPLFEKHDVQLVFTGHDHHYERSHPRQDFVVDAVPTTYVVTGGGGAWLRGARAREHTAAIRSAYHFVGVQVAGDRLTGEAIDEDGATFDTWSINKN